jgi:hypothetical protein
MIASTMFGVTFLSPDSVPDQFVLILNRSDIQILQCTSTRRSERTASQS